MSSIAHLSLAEYDRIVRAGVFDQRRRVELIRGEIREMNPIGPQHEDVLERLTEWSYRLLPLDSVRIRVQDSVGLPGLESVPEPDLVWAVRRDYSRGRPTAEEILLLVEVAESSLPYDVGEKADLYAAADIADYWVVDLAARAIEVRRDPLGSRYRSLQTFTGTAEIRPLRFPDVILQPAMLWQD